MKIKKLIVLTVISVSLTFTMFADEGMWLPLLLGNNYQEMQRLGLKLTPEQMYDINHSSLKDAIVVLDGGSCTGEIISPEGLILTNHHCGYGEIQAHSSVDHDYLTDGFWAMTKDEELINPNKTVSFLIRMEDVTNEVLKDITSSLTESERSKAIKAAIAKIEKNAVKDSEYEAEINSFFNGNQFFLFVYETFKDVRLVGAPPSSIGKFGGETDNWMWPRHTGDFSIFRVYCSPDGKPAAYAKENIPYKPKHYLPISLKGYKENDFAMIWGYPGRTDRYLTSFGVDEKVDLLNPATVKLRNMKMQIMKEYMDKSDLIRIQYAEKYAYLGNFWKKDMEEAKALVALKVADEKRKLEKDFVAWANENVNKKEIYGNVISDLQHFYDIQREKKYDLARWYLIESAFNKGVEIFSFSFQNMDIIDSLEKGKLSKEFIESVKKAADEFYKDYNPEIDQKILAAMFNQYYIDIPTELHPDILEKVAKDFDNDFTKYAQFVFKKSIFASKETFYKFLDKPKMSKIKDDPAIAAMQSLFGTFMKYQSLQGEISSTYTKARRLFVAGLLDMIIGKNFYPDANSTMRVTYGKVIDYFPRDAVHYNYVTTMKGIMEKENPNDPEFVVPAKLKEIYKQKDFGQYGENGIMPVCFLTDNDITGGNSGSPVLNAYGELIGTAFDGNSEALSSDIKFDPELQRTIVCDIRYILLVIDKFAGAKNLINEMTLVK